MPNHDSSQSGTRLSGSSSEEEGSQAGSDAASPLTAAHEQELRGILGDRFDAVVRSLRSDAPWLASPNRADRAKLRKTLVEAKRLIESAPPNLRTELEAPPPRVVLGSLGHLMTTWGAWDRLQETKRAIERTIRDLRSKRGRRSEERRLKVILAVGIALRENGYRLSSTEAGRFWRALQVVLRAYGCSVPAKPPADVKACVRELNAEASETMRTPRHEVNN